MLMFIDRTSSYISRTTSFNARRTGIAVLLASSPASTRALIASRAAPASLSAVSAGESMEVKGRGERRRSDWESAKEENRGASRRGHET